MYTTDVGIQSIAQTSSAFFKQGVAVTYAVDVTIINNDADDIVDLTGGFMYPSIENRTTLY